MVACYPSGYPRPYTQNILTNPGYLNPGFPYNRKMSKVDIFLPGHLTSATSLGPSALAPTPAAFRRRPRPQGRGVAGDASPAYQ